MATYMQAPGYAEMLIALNGWDAEVLDRFRSTFGDAYKELLVGEVIIIGE